MNGKKAKKIRQEFRREYREKAHQLAEQHMRILKAKPKWVPMRVWIFLLRIFLKIK